MLQDINDFSLCRSSLLTIRYLGDDNLNCIPINGMVYIISSDKVVLLFSFETNKTEATFMGMKNAFLSNGPFWFRIKET